MLHVSLLGEQAITDDRTGSVRTRSSRTVALVAFLVAHAGSPQTRQRIAGLFWPDSTDAQALTNLRRELHHLRQVLGDEPSLVVTSRDLCWRDTETCRVDLRIFDDRARRLPWRRRRPMMTRGSSRTRPRPSPSTGATCCPACTTTGCSRPGRSSSASAWTCAICSARRGRARGDLTGAVDAARRRIQLQPLEEVGYRTLMQLQADLGDRAGAVSTYHHCASVLERELGVIPDAATRQTFQRLMAHADPAGARPPAVEPAGRPLRVRRGAARRPVAGARPAPGRCGGPPRRAARGLALVRGGAGVGKTRLVAEVAEMARLQGAVVASSQCFGTSGRLALAPVADWLRNPAVQSATATLDPAWRAEVDRLVPAGGPRRTRRPARGRWSTPGSATASSRAWRGR